MSDELFSVPPSPSPRLAWLERNCLTLRTVPAIIMKYECILDEENVGRGADADEAIIDFCIKTKMKHWSQET